MQGAQERARGSAAARGGQTQTRYSGVMPVEIDEGEGQPSRWNTLRALRVLRWFEQARNER
jgi:hypothetical protein